MCVRCGKTGRIKARRMCDGCYEQTRRDGTADQYTPVFRHSGDVLRWTCGLWDIDIVQLVEGADFEPRRYAAHAMRDRFGWTLRVIGDQLGADHRTVSRWLNRPPPVPPHATPQPQHHDVCVVEGCGRPPHSAIGLCAGHKSRRRRDGGRIRPEPLGPNRIRIRLPDVCAGTATSYRDGCRCDVCCAAATRRRQLSELAGRKLVPVDQAVAHMAEGRRRGMTIAGFAKAAGVDKRRLYGWTGGKNLAGRRETVAAVLTVPLVCESCDQTAWEGGLWCRTHWNAYVRQQQRLRGAA